MVNLTQVAPDGHGIPQPTVFPQIAGGNTACGDCCFGIPDDERIMRYIELGCAVKRLGRGHILRIRKGLWDRVGRGEVKTWKGGRAKSGEVKT